MKKHLAILAALLSTAPAAAQPEGQGQQAQDQAQAQAQDPAQARPQSSIRPGDDQLSCEQLTAEAETLQMEFEGMSREITTAAAEQMRAAQAAQAGQMASSMASMIPIIGPLIGRGTQMAGQAQMARQTEQMMAMSERMMTRGGEVARRLNRVEILRNARCRNAAGLMMPTQAQAEASVAPQQQQALGREAPDTPTP
jgi:hypothetical protein